jgi:hypothetical protein
MITWNLPSFLIDSGFVLNFSSRSSPVTFAASLGRVIPQAARTVPTPSPNGAAARFGMGRSFSHGNESFRQNRAYPIENNRFKCVISLARKIAYLIDWQGDICVISFRLAMTEKAGSWRKASSCAPAMDGSEHRSFWPCYRSYPV